MKQAMSLKDFEGIGKGRKRVERKNLTELGMLVYHLFSAASFDQDEVEDFVKSCIKELDEDEFKETIDNLSCLDSRHLGMRGQELIGAYTGILATILTEQGVEKIHLNGKGRRFDYLLLNARNLNELIIENFKGYRIASCCHNCGIIGTAKKIRVINCEGDDIVSNGGSDFRRPDEIQIINHKGWSYDMVCLRQDTRADKVMIINHEGILNGFGATKTLLALNCTTRPGCTRAFYLEDRYSWAETLILGRVGQANDVVFPHHNTPKTVLAYKTPGYKPQRYRLYYGDGRIKEGQGYDGEEAEQRHLELTGISFPLMCKIAEEMKTMTAEEIMQRADWIASLYEK